MKTFVGLFMSSAIFAAAISIVYWFASHEYAGTLFLGFMCCALGFAAGYAMLFEREANLAGDDPEALQREAAGVLWFFIGLIWSDFMIFTGLAAMLLCLWRLGAESGRVGHERVWTEDGPEDAT
jgi:hypothetical protein